jgi:hypothetical protein
MKSVLRHRNRSRLEQIGINEKLTGEVVQQPCTGLCIDVAYAKRKLEPLYVVVVVKSVLYQLFSRCIHHGHCMTG